MYKRQHIGNVPTILDLCKSVAINKNKLQKAFQLTEGKSVGEYSRTLRMERALEFLEKSDMSTTEIAKAVGYHGAVSYTHLDVYKRQVQQPYACPANTVKNKIVQHIR